MRVNRLGRSLVFGAGVAISLVFVQHLAAPFVGSASVLSIYLSAATIAYCVLIASTPQHALRNAMVALGGCVLVTMMAGGITGLSIGLTGVIAFVRSGLEYSVTPVRALVLESLLGGLALGFGSWIASPGWFGFACGLWGFALVQSLFFLQPEARLRRASVTTGDRFDRARERILVLLEQA